MVPKICCFWIILFVIDSSILVIIADIPRLGRWATGSDIQLGKRTPFRLIGCLYLSYPRIGRAKFGPFRLITAACLAKYWLQLHRCC